MYCVDEVLKKLNGKDVKKNNSTSAQQVTLCDIMTRSFSEVKKLAGDNLSWGEANFLYKEAQKEYKNNKITESRILSRANPQLENAVRLGICQSSMLRGYNDVFPERASTFVKPGAASSMFSPAAYLTELYRESKNLHAEASEYHLDTRRPDLASLSLSQSNMDDELSTLSLSNELCLNNIQSQESKDYDGVLEMLSTYRQTGATPYHQSYEATRQAILLQDPEFTAFHDNPAVAGKMDTASLLSIQANISPELHEILTEDITEDNVDALIAKNFGENTSAEAFRDIRYLARYYGLTYDEITSLLGLVTAGTEINPAVQLYKDDQLVSLLNTEEGELSALLIKRTPGGNTYQFGYTELVPTGLNDYLFNFTIVNNARVASMAVGTSGYGSKDIFYSGSYNVQKDVPVSLPVSLSDEKIKKTVNIGVTRSGGQLYANVNFDISSFPFDIFLLKLNKLIRLYKATGIAPSDIRTVIESSNSNLTINAEVLSQLFWVNSYMQHYGIDAAAALVLSGAFISRTAHNSQPDAFTRLFNSPSLNGQVFAADDAVIKLKPSEINDTFRSGVLKRAFQVNDTELYTLWALATGNAIPPDFTCNINNLSKLYRISLLADIHGVSVTELAALLSVSPYATQAIDSLSGTGLARLVSFIEQSVQWLAQMNWTVSDLYLMTTDRYSTTMSPDTENLVATVKNGLLNQTFSDDASEAEYISAAAPFIAAAMQLDSSEMAAAVLQWLGQLKPQGLTVTAFLTLATKEKLTEAETVQLVSFCQVLGQLTLFARRASLSATELSWVVAHPTIMTEKATVLAHDIAMLRDLTLLHGVLARCGGSATQVITSLSGKAGSETNNLPVKTVAVAMNLDEQALTQALAQCSGYAYFYSWIHLRDALQWLDAASTFGISPGALGSLLNLMYTDPNKRPLYSDWMAASRVLQAGLNARQTEQLQAVEDEALSAAASAYMIKNIAPSWVTDRDKLYGWLLIDNQVSAGIKTTRIAEAIASVQLYVNRALSGQEEGVDNAVKARQFFSADWDTCNKRYSTWAGVSQLVYYPENYVDPTMRLGQTGMMDEMLQSLSQSQLTSDTVETAFKTYMTRFEEIANLDVISGYHDGVNATSGKTYLIGRSAIGEYYWRRADIDKMSDGRLPANAWSEWKKITAGIAPVTNLVRPVIFQSRLYVLWVESREVANTGSTTTKSVEYLLKYAHILHDGTWSAPVSVTLQQGTLPLNNVSIDDTGMYCAKDMGQEKLYIYFYKKENSYSVLPSGTAGLSLFSSGQTDIISADAAAKMTGYIYLQLDTTSAVRMNTPYTGGSTTVSVSGATRTDYQWGYGNYTILFNGSITDTSASVLDDQVEVNFSAVARVVYSGSTGARSRTLVEMMKSTGTIGDKYYLPNSIKKGTFASSMGFTNECVVNQSTQWVYFKPSENYLGPVGTGNPFIIYMFNVYYAIASSDPRSSYLTTRDAYGLWGKSDARVKELNQNIYVCRSNPFPGAGYDFEFSAFKFINTGINHTDVTLSVSSGLNPIIVSDNCSKYTFDESLFNFKNKTISVPLSAFSHNAAQITFKMSATAPSGDGRSLGSETFRITLHRVDESSMPVISLNETTDGAQYLQYGAYCIRVNTLFAKQLVARANTGLNAVLTMDTQQLQEPKLGEGSFVEITFSRYDAALHGDGSYKLYLVGARNKVNGSRSKDLFASGSVAENDKTTVRVFVPWIAGKETEPNTVYIGVDYSDNKFSSSATHMQSFTFNTSTKVFAGVSANATRTRGLTSNVLNSQTEPMDFSGANAIYFWEMFYYVPMMVFKRLLSEGKFTEATQWIKYVWSPDGYVIDGELAPYQWNVRPLEEETTWHANPLDSVDPDAVAQADPMHYKVATFMAWLDLLIARGDAAYRQLERDTLNEAKMWYVQALDVLGDEPYLHQNVGWASPRLTDAANKTTKKSVQQALMDVRRQVASGELRTANSLTDLFLPQQNEKLVGYWQTLAQRLYNLRHNLSIDGTPLSLSIYAAAADPASLLNAAVNASQGGGDLPMAVMPLYRFPVILESARGMVGQLSQFGNTLLSITERQDAEALSELLQTQGSELVVQSIALQDKNIAEIDADQAMLEESLSGAQSRLDSYTALYEENVNTGEKQAMDLYLSSSVISASATALHMAGAALEMVPNIYGMAVGGARYGALLNAGAIGMQIGGDSTRIAADRISKSEGYRRRRQEWEIQRNNAQADVKQIGAQLAALAVRREGAVLQKAYLETQQSQTQAQMAFLQNKFTSKALYNWLRGKLAAIYYQFCDLTVSRCLMAQKAWQWDCNDEATSFVRPGVWQGTCAGLLAGETLMLNLAQMEKAYLELDQRALEVTRTVCLSEVYAGLSAGAFILADEITELVNAGKGSVGTAENGLSVADKQLQATLKLSELAIKDDYPDNLGTTRRIRQVSVTLPALVGPYQDVRAVLSYGGSVVMPRGCKALAVSHGMNDSGQFQLDFNDPRYLPFEGIPVGDEGTLTLSFPDADSKQKALLLSLTDIIVHIRYTIL